MTSQRVATVEEIAQDLLSNLEMLKIECNKNFPNTEVIRNLVQEALTRSIAVNGLLGCLKNKRG